MGSEMCIRDRFYGRVLRVGRFKGVSQILLTPTPVAMVTKICDFQHKNGHNSACIRDMIVKLALIRGIRGCPI